MPSFPGLHFEENRPDPIARRTRRKGLIAEDAESFVLYIPSRPNDIEPVLLGDLDGLQVGPLLLQLGEVIRIQVDPDGDHFGDLQFLFRPGSACELRQ